MRDGFFHRDVTGSRTAPGTPHLRRLRIASCSKDKCYEGQRESTSGGFLNQRRRPEYERGESYKVEGNSKVPVLYTPLGLSNTTWKVAFGDGLRRRQVRCRQASWGSLK